MPDPSVQLLADIDTMTAAFVASIVDGATEPDGVALSLGGGPVANDPKALGYGTDLSCAFTGDGTGDIDIDDNASEIDPNSPLAVEQAAIRFFSTPNGQLLGDGSPEAQADLVAVGEDPTYGYNLLQLLSIGMDAREYQAHTDLAAAAFMQSDDRVKTCTITLQEFEGGKAKIFFRGELYSGIAYKGVMPLTSDTIPKALST